MERELISLDVNKDNGNRHAFLILAHQDNLTFRTLISMLDHPNNDIFIHMDSKNKNYNEKATRNLIKYSNLYHCKRTQVNWGGYSQINAELLLLKEAVAKGHYQYYHLLSGQDLPIKTQNQIHSFFNKNNGKEFVRFQSPTFDYESRIRYYYPLQEKIGKKGSLLLRAANKIFLIIQKALGIHRNRGIKFQKGTNWFSITDQLANYIIEQESWIKKTFKKTLCPDELFLQTIINNNPTFKKNLYYAKFDNNLDAIMRLIDWNRGDPYIFRMPDYKEIQQSKYLFARKFDNNIDEKIIYKIKESFTTQANS